MTSPVIAPTSGRALPAAAVADLRRTVTGAVVYPPDVAWPRLTGAHHPAAVVVAESEHDVSAALVVADAHALSWQVGHAAEPWTGDLLLLLERLPDPPATGPYRVVDRQGCALVVDEVGPAHLLLARPADGSHHPTDHDHHHHQDHDQETRR